MSNKQRIYDYVDKRGARGATVSDLKRDLGLTHPTASAAQAEMKREGSLVVTGDYIINERGKKEEVFVTPRWAKHYKPRGRTLFDDDAA